MAPHHHLMMEAVAGEVATSVIKVLGSTEHKLVNLEVIKLKFLLVVSQPFPDGQPSPSHLGFGAFRVFPSHSLPPDESSLNRNRQKLPQCTSLT